MSRFIISALALITSVFTQAQSEVKDSILFDPHITISYAHQFPGGDMSSRFKNNHNVGMGFHFKDKKSWYYGVEGSYFFGSHVIAPAGFMQNLYIDGKYILDNDGQIATISLQERGWTLTANGGRLFNVLGPNVNSGILVYAGLGFMQHKIRIEHQETHIKQLEEEYLKGYDRLTNGLMVSGFAGYYHMSNNRLVNFMIGLEFMNGFTQSRRDLNFDTGTTDQQKRSDSLLGLRVGWTLHLYKRMADNYYYY